MQLRFETWPVDGGYGYTIFSDEKAWIVQPHNPAEPGFVSMTQDEAINYASQIIDQLQSQDS